MFSLYLKAVLLCARYDLGDSGSYLSILREGLDHACILEHPHFTVQ